MKTLKDKKAKEPIDKNFFKAMNYELAGEIGIVDNEEMKNNELLDSNLESKDDMTKLAGTVETLALLKTRKELKKQ